MFIVYLTKILKVDFPQGKKKRMDAVGCKGGLLAWKCEVTGANSTILVDWLVEAIMKENTFIMSICLTLSHQRGSAFAVQQVGRGPQLGLVGWNWLESGENWLESLGQWLGVHTGCYS